MRESTIEAHLVKCVKAAGGEVRKVTWGGRKGAPDRLVMLPARKLTTGLDCAWCSPKGRALWVELKAPGKKAEAHQLREHKRMADMGQEVHVIDSIEGVDKLMEGL